MKTFTIGDALSNAWRITKSNFLFLVGVVVILFVIQFALGWIGEYFSREVAWLGAVFSIITLLIQVLLNVGAIAIVLKLVDGVQPKFTELFTTTKPYLQFVFVTILMSIIVGVGFILLIIPGIMLAIGLQFATYLVVDKGMGAVEALKESWEITKGMKWKLFGFALVIWLVNIVGLVLFGVGMLVTIPLTMIAMAYVYRTLEKQTGGDVVVAPPSSPTIPPISNPAV